jgi:hypothetical protein
MDAEELELVRTTLEQVLTTSDPAGVPAALLDAGWIELVADDPYAARAALFEVQGRTRVATPALDLVALEALGLALTADVAVVHPRVEDRDRFGCGRVVAGTVSVSGLLLRGSERATTLAIPVASSAGPAGDAVALTAADGPRRLTIRGFDPALGLTRIEGEAELRSLIPMGLESGAACISGCQHALAHELLGVADAMRASTIEHVIAREQFGRALATLQTVRHRVADIEVAVAGARATVAALEAVQSPLSGRVAKAAAGRAALVVARHAQQLGGAIGFTEEHPLPTMVRRVNMLDAFLGSSAWLEGEIGSELLAGGVPRLFGI